jgi:hypothetical protein
MASASCLGKPSLQALGIPGPDCPKAFRKCSIVTLLPVQRNQTNWLVLSVTCGAVGAMGPVYTKVPVSLAFQAVVVGHVVEGSIELQVPVCVGNQWDLLTSAK